MARAKLLAALREVELIRGHDGFLRGRPEPVLLFAFYALGRWARAMGVERRALPLPGALPLTVRPAEGALFGDAIPHHHTRVLLLALALEEDRGADVTALQEALGSPKAWTLRDRGSPLAVPFALPELRLLRPNFPPLAQPVRLCLEGTALSQLCTRDDWVGACAVLVDARKPQHETWQMPFTSEDGRNHWIAHVELGIDGGRPRPPPDQDGLPQDG